MLHTSGLNKTEQNFNYSTVHSFNFYENSELTNSNGSSKGGNEIPKVVMSVDKDRKNRKRRVVNVRNDMTTPTHLDCKVDALHDKLVISLHESYLERHKDCSTFLAGINIAKGQFKSLRDFVQVLLR
ncbi:Uncharacterized protein OBRU01_08969, partial [Operophtera brumata]